MTKGVSATITYKAVNASAAPVDNDQSHHTLVLVRDNNAAQTPANAASVSSRGAGLYAITLTAAEMNADAITLSGTSATSGVVIIDRNIAPSSGETLTLADESFSTRTE